VDHLVLTVFDVDRSAEFYERVLELEPVTFPGGGRGLRCGWQTLKLHAASELMEPTATHPVPGAMSLCLVVTTSLSEVQEQLRAHDVRIEQGPVARTGAHGSITSLYLRDPDGNLIEVARYDRESASSRESA
jgi:catechol 2,3-dioxygenase-like lactoylglutathione lyase family enzyme